MKKETIKRAAGIVLGAAFVVAIIFSVQLYLGFVNVGQEFGAYGQYNRVLRIINETEELELVNSRLRRKLELGSYSTLENFSVSVRNEAGRTAVVSFDKGTEAFAESDRERLKEIILDRAQIGFLNRNAAK